jgi:hypothetical protein
VQVVGNQVSDVLTVFDDKDPGHAVIVSGRP